MAISIPPEEFFASIGEPDASGYTAPLQHKEPAEPAPGADHRRFLQRWQPAPSESEPAEQTRTEERPSFTPAYDPRVDVLQQTVNALLSRPQSGQTEPQKEERGWKQRDFLTPEDAQLLLTSPDPAGQLNKTFNKVAAEVFAPLQEELAKRDHILLGMHQEQQRRQLEAERAAAAQANQQAFYSLHEDLDTPAYRGIVAQEAQAIALESQRNPAAFAGMSNEALFGVLATRVRSTIEAIRGGGEAPANEGSVAGAHTFLERGSGSRGGITTPTNPNSAAMREMDRYVRSGRI